MRLFLIASLALALATPAFADSIDNQSAASAEALKAAAALTEAGLKTAVALAVLPAAVAGAGSLATGESVAGVGTATLRQARDGARFANQPLAISDDVVIRPQPAPVVPVQARDERK